MKTFSYGAHQDQLGDLYRSPTSGLQPVLVVIHGGYWKQNHTLNTYATKSIVDKYKTSGVAVWNLEYRRMEEDGENLAAPWPSAYEDIAAGMDFLRSIAIDEALDLDRILVVGHSAGGHLAAWAGSRGAIPTTSELYVPDPVLPAHVISVAGILDLRENHELSQPHQVTRLIGGGPSKFPERFAVSNPAQLASAPLPMTLVHGKLDEEVSPMQSTAFSRRSGRTDVRLVELESADHFGMLPLEGQVPADWQTLTDLISAELESLGAHHRGLDIKAPK